ncbi:MAG: hypothetical protein H6Q00_2447 [Holophagaceae bacterium]|nr:hypothetical protein [Holophagaceae bacterium]
MANNSKSAGTTASADHGLEAKLSEALENVHSGKGAKAQELLEALAKEASEAGNLAVARRVRNSLMALARKGDQASLVVPASNEMAVQVHLNRGEAKEALALAESVLKADSGRATVHYLKAVALAQLGEADASAEALGKALAIEPGLHHQYLLEKDFDGVRATSVFGEYERL